MKYECTFCDITFDNYKDSADCRKNGHEIMKFFEKKELRDVEIDNESDIQFTITNKGKSFKIAVLDHPIISLRPQTLLEDGSRMILVYLPVREKEISDKATESKFINKAFFVIYNPISDIEKKTNFTYRT